MPEIASLGLELNTKQVVEGTKALDAFGASAAAVEPKVEKVTKAADDLSKASAQVWRYGTDAAKSVDSLGEATVRTGARVATSNGQMNDTVKIMRAQAEEAKAVAAANVALGTSSNQASIGAQIFIDKLKDQVAVLGMSRSQLAAYQAAQLGVSTQAQQSVAALKAYEDAIKAAADAKAQATKQSNILTDSIKLLAAGYGALKLGEYIKDAALLAARYETLGVVAEVVGKNAGYTKTQMDTATDAIARQGITMIESRQSAIKLVQAHVDLTNATGLARIAQDAAVIGNINSSESFDRLVNGISRGNVLILRNIGINVNLQSAYQQMAAELGKTTKELTENERVQARLNAVIERGADIAGTYEASMDTAGKQLKSMQRYTEDLKTVIGETFNETLTIGVMALTDGLKDANKEVTELSKNQQLHEWGRSLADVFVWVANKVGNATTVLQQAWAWADHKSARDDINGKFDDQVKDPKTQGDLFDVSGRSDRIRRINSERAAALAQETVDYVTHQAELSGQYDRFAKAAEERQTAMTVKHKAEAEARFKVDQDYAAKATALLVANAGKSVEAQQAAQVALAKSVYVGTPTYRDTEGREPKPKVDKVESTELADRLARIQDDVNAEKAMYETMSKMDDMFHAAGKMGDEEFYRNKRAYAAAAAKDQIDGYTDQIAKLRAYHNGTEAEAAKHAKQINDIEAKRTAADAAAQDERNLLDAKEFLRKDAIESSSDEALNKYLSGLDQEAKKLEESNSAHETSKAAIEREAVARLDLAIAEQRQFIAGQDSESATEKEISQGARVLKFLEDERAARARIAAATGQGEFDVANKKMLDQSIQDWKTFGQQIAEGLTSAFGDAGKALGGVLKGYADGVAAQISINKQLAISTKGLTDDDPRAIQAASRARRDSATSQIKSYGDMTGAAKSYFNENSTGYKVLGAAEKTFRAFELAMSVQSMAAKLFETTTVTGAKLAGNAAEVAGVVTTVPVVLGAEAVKSAAYGTTALAASLTVPPPFSFATFALTAALLAGIGVAVSGSGGGGGDTSKHQQEVQGTGSVLGDSSAKSDSVARAIELAAANSNIELTHTAGMLISLRAIESSIGGLGNLLIRGSGLTGEMAPDRLAGAQGFFMNANDNSIARIFAGPLGTITNKLVGNLLGGKITTLDTGVTAGASSLGSIATNGLNAQQYTDIKKSGGLFRSDKYSTSTTDLGSEASDQFAKVILSLSAGVKSAAELLGVGGDAFTAKLNSFVVDIGKISLKDLKGEDIQSALEAVFSKLGDDMAQFGVAGLEKFQQVGEGYFETLTRVATDYANLNSIMESIGTTFGATGMSSIAAREHLIELAGGIDQLASQSNSFVENFMSKAEQLAPVQKYVTDQLAAMGLQGVDTRDKFKDVVLGLANSGALATDAGAKQYTALLALADAFAKTHAATEDLTKTEQEIGDERKDLRNKLDDLTMTEVQLAEKARSAIDSHNLALYDQVVAAQAAKDAIAEAGNILDLQGQMYAASGDKAAAAAVLEKQHIAALVGMSPALADATKALWNAQAAAAASKDVLGNVSKAYADLQAVVGKQKDDLNASYELASTALKASIDSVTDSVAKLKSLSEELHSTLDSMTIPGNEKNDRLAAQAQIEAALAIAKAGGPLPTAEDLKGALSTVAKDASGQFASYTDYMRDLYRTKNNVGGLSGLTDAELSTEQLTLKSLNDQKTALDAAHKEDLAKLDATLQQAKTQTDLLSGIYTSLLTLPQALAALGSAVATAQANPTVGATTGMASLYQSLLGRAPDAAGLAFWQMQVANGASLDAVKGAITTSSEYTKLHPFAIGTNSVPTDMPALIHAGERIVPAADNRELMSRLRSPSGNNDALMAEVKLLRAAVEKLQAPADRSASSNEKIEKTLVRSTQGGDYIMVKAVPA